MLFYCNFSGMLAAWFRMKYPNIVAGLVRLVNCLFLWNCVYSQGNSLFALGLIPWVNTLVIKKVLLPWYIPWDRGPTNYRQQPTTTSVVKKTRKVTIHLVTWNWCYSLIRVDVRGWVSWLKSVVEYRRLQPRHSTTFHSKIENHHERNFMKFSFFEMFFCYLSFVFYFLALLRHQLQFFSSKILLLVRYWKWPLM
jgi:hypothetical protein